MKSNKSVKEMPIYSSVKLDYERNSKDSTKKEIINKINELNEKLSPKRSYNVGSFQTKSYGSELMNRNLAQSQTQYPLKSKVLTENFFTRRESEPHQEVEKTVERDNKLEKEYENEIKTLKEELEKQKKLLSEKKNINQEKV